MLMVTAAATYAKPYLPLPQTRAQADGSTLTVKTHGDEHFRYTTTADDLLVVDSAGILFFADNEGRNSGRRAKEADERTRDDLEFLEKVNQAEAVRALHRRTGDRLKMPVEGSNNRLKAAAGKGDMPEIRALTRGKKRIPVILVESAQKRLMTKASDWDELLNQPGYSKNNHQGSIRDYYLTQSRGALELNFEVYGPVYLSQRVEDMGDADILKEALAEVTGDAAAYDDDNDGYLDCTILVVAGQDTQEDNGNHGTYSYHNQYNHQDVWMGGKRAGRYIYTSECSPYSKTAMDGAGSIIHEMGHVLGLPDLYPVGVSTEVDTPKQWDVMDVGCYNGWAQNYTIAGTCVPNLSASQLMCLGWLEPLELNSDSVGQYTLPQLMDDKAYVVRTNQPNELFVLENRQKTGWDRELPGHGLLVWHLVYDYDLWFYNRTNQSNEERHWYLEPAAARTGSDKLAYVPYPGKGKVTTMEWLADKMGHTYDPGIDYITEQDGYVCFATNGAPIEECPCAKKDESHSELTEAQPYPAPWVVTDALGRVVRSGDNAPNLEGLAKGAYVVRVGDKAYKVAR